jgi:ribonuclease R
LGERTGRALNQIFEILQKRPGSQVLQTQVLKSLKLAEYNPDNRGHFGLASTCYAHFTSPIRRYADLMVHHRLTRLLANPGLGPEHFDDSELSEIAGHISDTERKAMVAEKTFRRIKVLRHVRANELGNEHDGVIESVKSYGMFIGIPELAASGLVRLDALGDDYYVHNPEALALVGSKSGKMYRVGDACRVKIVMVDLITRRLDLLLLSGPTAPPADTPPPRDRRKKVPRTLKVARGPGGPKRGKPRSGGKKRGGGGRGGGRGKRGR